MSSAKWQPCYFSLIELTQKQALIPWFDPMDQQGQHPGNNIVQKNSPPRTAVTTTPVEIQGKH